MDPLASDTTGCSHLTGRTVGQPCSRSLPLNKRNGAFRLFQTGRSAPEGQDMIVWKPVLEWSALILRCLFFCVWFHQVFVELNELIMDKNQEMQWRETARWIKFEEDVEEETDRWGKPHVASLSFRSLLELRRTISHGERLDKCSRIKLFLFFIFDCTVTPPYFAFYRHYEISYKSILLNWCG